jgi:hypothetical protein
MNVFTGTIPTEIGKLVMLKELMWSRTHMSGPIPKELGNLTGIENLEMYGNQLTGNIPASLGTCTALKRMGKKRNRMQHYQTFDPGLTAIHFVPQIFLTTNSAGRSQLKSLISSRCKFSTLSSIS